MASGQAPIPTGSKQDLLTAVTWAFTGLAIVTVFTKLYSTVVVFRRPGWDDAIIFMALLSSIVASGLVQASNHLGLGRHTAAVMAEGSGLANMSLTKKLQILGYPFNILAYSLPNIAILILIERLAGRTDTISRTFLRGVVTIQVIFAFISVIIIFVQCRPVQFSWDQTIDGTCWNPNVFNYTSYMVSAFTAFTDLVLAIVPIQAFWKLKLKTQEKMEISFMLGLTMLSAVFTIVKATNLSSFNDRTDPLYNVVDLVIWGLIEQNIVIMAASVPTLRPLFRHIKQKSSTHGSDSYFRSDVNPDSNGYFRKGSKGAHAESVSEVPLDNMKQQVGNGSQRSFEPHKSSDEYDSQATGRWE